MNAEAQQQSPEKTPTDGRKHFEAPHRVVAQTAVLMWYEMQVDHGTALYHVERKRSVAMDVPEDRVRSVDQLAERRRENPAWWRTQVRRPTGRVHSDGPRKGQPIMEYVSIHAALTADANETRRQQRAQAPKGRGADVEVVPVRDEEHARRVQANISTMAKMHPIMKRLEWHSEAQFHVVCMWAAGWKMARIGKVLRASTSTAQQILECAFAAIGLMLASQVQFYEKLGDLPRPMVLGDIDSCSN